MAAESTTATTMSTTSELQQLEAQGIEYLERFFEAIDQSNFGNALYFLAIALKRIKQKSEKDVLLSKGLEPSDFYATHFESFISKVLANNENLVKKNFNEIKAFCEDLNLRSYSGNYHFSRLINDGSGIFQTLSSFLVALQTAINYKYERPSAAIDFAMPSNIKLRVDQIPFEEILNQHGSEYPEHEFIEREEINPLVGEPLFVLVGAAKNHQAEQKKIDYERAALAKTKNEIASKKNNVEQLRIQRRINWILSNLKQMQAETRVPAHRAQISQLREEGHRERGAAQVELLKPLDSKIANLVPTTSAAFDQSIQKLDEVLPSNAPMYRTTINQPNISVVHNNDEHWRARFRALDNAKNKALDNRPYRYNIFKRKKYNVINQQVQVIENVILSQLLLQQFDYASQGKISISQLIKNTEALAAKLKNNTDSVEIIHQLHDIITDLKTAYQKDRENYDGKYKTSAGSHSVMAKKLSVSAPAAPPAAATAEQTEAVDTSLPRSASSGSLGSSPKTSYIDSFLALFKRNKSFSSHSGARIGAGVPSARSRHTSSAA